MKIPSTKKLKKQAASFNRKRSKKITRGYIKSIIKIIKSESKSGKFSYHKTFNEQYDNFWETLIAFKWLRRYTDLNIAVIETINERYIDSFEVIIKWY